MDDPTNRGRRRPRLPGGLLGAMALILAVEALFSRYAIEFATGVSWDWTRCNRQVGREAPRNEILCFGDSTIKMSIMPKILGERTGRRAYNFALMAGQAPASYFLLRRAIEAGARPEAVLVSFEPCMLLAPPAQNARHWPELLTIRETLDFAWAARDADLGASILLSRLFTSARARFEIRSRVLAALRGLSASPRDIIEMVDRNRWANRGGQAIGPNPDVEQNPPRVDEAACAHVGWRCHPVNIAYLLRFLDLAESRKIVVYWVLPPVLPPFQDAYDRIGTASAFTRMARAAIDRYANLTVVDARHSGYDLSAFADQIHTNTRGAAAFSGGLTAALRASPTSARWVELPAYRGHPPGLVLEDIDQSRLALLRSRGMLR
jgi:hypothetical protein